MILLIPKFSKISQSLVYETVYDKSESPDLHRKVTPLFALAIKKGRKGTNSSIHQNNLPIMCATSSSCMAY